MLHFVYANTQTAYSNNYFFFVKYLYSKNYIYFFYTFFYTFAFLNR